MALTADEVFRDHVRFENDGLLPVRPGVLPYGDPMSGRHHPTNAQIRDWAGGVDLAKSQASAAALTAQAAADLAQGYTEAAVSASNVPIYATKATAAGIDIPNGMNSVRTSGFGSVGDGGAAIWKRVGSQPSHPGKFQDAGGTWWELGEQDVTPRMFGAVATATAATTRLAILDMFAYLASKLANTGHREAPKGFGGSAVYTIDQTLVLSASGIQIECMALKASDTFTTGTPLLQVNGEENHLVDCIFDGNKRAAGLKINNRLNTIRSPVAYRFRNFGVELGGNGGNRLVDPFINQWVGSDAESGIDSQFDAVGLLVSANDQKMNGGMIRFCGTCVRFAPGANTTNIWDAHIYNGRPGSSGPRIDPILVSHEAGRNRLIGCYLGNGQINDYTGGNITINDCTYLLIPEAAQFTQRYAIGIWASKANDAARALSIENLRTGAGIFDENDDSGIALVKFLATAPNSWNGNYGTINRQMESVRSVSIQASLRTIDISTSPSGADKQFMTPADQINHDFYVGGNALGANPDLRMAVLGDRLVFRTPRLQVMNYGGNVNYLQLGSAENGIWVDDAGNTIIKAGAANRWRFDAGGALRPNSTGQDLGATSTPIARAYIAQTLTTSDERAKDWLGFDDAEIRVARALADSFGFFRWKDSKDGRRQFGVRAQQVVAAFEAEGLTALDYGMVTYDAENDRFSVDYDQLNGFVLAALARHALTLTR